MARRNKLEKFAEILSYPNVYENYNPKEPKLVTKDMEEIDLKGKWNKDHFKNKGKLVLELACGRGEYSLGLAKMYPEKNFIGVDVKGARIWKGATIALNENYTNVAFLRTRIEQIDLFFDQAEISEIWITFPDPFLRESKENRRLSSPMFLNKYKKLLEPQATINLKTDSEELYNYTKEVLMEREDIDLIYDNHDIYAGELAFAELEIMTYYEKMHLADNKTIKFLRFRFK